MKSACKVVIKLETHTAFLGADNLVREVIIDGKPAYADGKPIREIDLRVAYVLRGNNSSATLGLRLPHRRTNVEYESSAGIFREGDFVSAWVVESERGNYRIVALLGAD